MLQHMKSLVVTRNPWLNLVNKICKLSQTCIKKILKCPRFHVHAYFLCCFSGGWVICIFVIFHQIKVPKHIRYLYCQLAADPGSWLILISRLERQWFIDKHTVSLHHTINYNGKKVLQHFLNLPKFLNIFCYWSFIKIS